jgi:hypothetical protein
MDAAAAFYAEALRLAAVPNPEDEDHEGGSAEGDAYWELSDEIEEAGAGAGLTEAEMTTLITAADAEHDGGSPLVGAAAIANLAAGRFGAGTTLS